MLKQTSRRDVLRVLVVVHLNDAAQNELVVQSDASWSR